MAELPIAQYSGFHDIPRVVFVRYRDELYVFDCDFDDDLDDYPPDFEVRTLDEEAYARFNRRELGLGDLIAGGRWVGTVPTRAVQFDETARKSVDDGIFASLGR